MMSRLAASNRLHSVYERCACWLLLSDERVQLTEIPLTQGISGHDARAKPFGRDARGGHAAEGRIYPL